LIGHSVDSTALTYTVSSSIVVSKTYKFRYRIKNVHGWSNYSDSLDLIAASVPDVIGTVTTYNEATNVRISWTAPAFNGGKPVLKYEIKIKTSTSSYEVESTSCNGTDSTILANAYCIIPMTKLTSAPFNLALNNLIVARVTATNVIGTNNPSTDNTAGA
jgi:hypothetical protein